MVTKKNRWFKCLGSVGITLMLCLTSVTSFGQAAPKRIALLVGVGDYIDPAMRDLQGPPFDVAAMRSVLVRRWGFRDQDIKSLVDKEATRANIAAELAALSKRSSPNDEVLVYFSGHGTSALDPNLEAMGIDLPHTTGAFVPADFKLTGNASAKDLIIGRFDLLPVFSALENAGRRIWMVSDSCYSGSQARNIFLPNADELPARMIPLKVDAAALAQKDALKRVNSAPGPGPFPYKTTVFLSASTEGETAKDIRWVNIKKTPTRDEKPHGALTDALLRVLEGEIPGDLDGDGVMTLNEVHRAVGDFMAQRAYGHSPMRLPAVAEDPNGLGNRAVLGMKGAAATARDKSIQPLRVRLESTGAALERSVSGVPDVRLVATSGEADIVVIAREGFLNVVTAAGDLIARQRSDEATRTAAQVRQLAWAHRVRALAEKHRRGALEVAIDPDKGGNFVPGDLISFVVRPAKRATVVLLNIDSLGKVSVIYPNQPHEATPISAGELKHIPGQEKTRRVMVKEPFGMDMQFVFAFDEPLAGIDKMYGVIDADVGDQRLQAFERTLGSMAGKFAFAATELRTLQP